jgi:hypothetical protein
MALKPLHGMALLKVAGSPLSALAVAIPGANTVMTLYRKPNFIAYTYNIIARNYIYPRLGK